MFWIQGKRFVLCTLAMWILVAAPAFAGVAYKQGVMIHYESNDWTSTKDGLKSHLTANSPIAIKFYEPEKLDFAFLEPGFANKGDGATILVDIRDKPTNMTAEYARELKAALPPILKKRGLTTNRISASIRRIGPHGVLYISMTLSRGSDRGRAVLAYLSYRDKSVKFTFVANEADYQRKIPAFYQMLRKLKIVDPTKPQVIKPQVIKPRTSARFSRDGLSFDGTASGWVDVTHHRRLKSLVASSLGSSFANRKFDAVLLERDFARQGTTAAVFMQRTEAQVPATAAAALAMQHTHAEGFRGKGIEVKSCRATVRSFGGQKVLYVATLLKQAGVEGVHLDFAYISNGEETVILTFLCGPARYAGKRSAFQDLLRTVKLVAPGGNRQAATKTPPAPPQNPAAQQPQASAPQSAASAPQPAAPPPPPSNKKVFSSGGFSFNYPNGWIDARTSSQHMELFNTKVLRELEARGGSVSLMLVEPGVGRYRAPHTMVLIALDEEVPMTSRSVSELRSRLIGGSVSLVKCNGHDAIKARTNGIVDGTRMDMTQFYFAGGGITYVMTFQGEGDLSRSYAPMVNSVQVPEATGWFGGSWSMTKIISVIGSIALAVVLFFIRSAIADAFMGGGSGGGGGRSRPRNAYPLGYPQPTAPVQQQYPQQGYPQKYPQQPHYPQQQSPQQTYPPQQPYNPNQNPYG